MSRLADLTHPVPAAERWTGALADGDRATAAGLLQIRAWELLSIYLNGGLGRGALAFPLAVTTSPLMARETAGLLRMWASYAAAFATEPAAALGPDPAEALAAHYRRFSGETDFLPPAGVGELDLSGVGRSPESGRLQRYLPRLGDEREFLHSFWLHGSSGDGGWKAGWSDVDTLAIVAGAALTSASALRRLRRGLIRRRSDLLHEQPFQFHGHFVLAEADLRNQPESMFPATLFAAATPLWRADASGPLNQRVDRELALRVLWTHGVQDLVEGVNRPLPRNAAKIFLLHRIYLLPCLYSQALGRPVPKEVAWAALDRILPDWSLDFFRSAGAVWEQWSPLPGGYAAPRTALRLFAANPFVYQRALRLVFDRLPFFRTEPPGGWQGLAREAARVAARLWTELPQEVADVD